MGAAFSKNPARKLASPEKVNILLPDEHLAFVRFSPYFVEKPLR